MKWEEASDFMQKNGTPLAMLGYCKIAFDLAIPRWIPTSKEMPPAGVPVLACVAPNEYGNVRRIRAQYAPPMTLEQSPECEGGTYCEETDTYYVDEGWYETNEYEDVNWNVGGTVTHWMALPLPPVE